MNRRCFRVSRAAHQTPPTRQPSYATNALSLLSTISAEDCRAPLQTVLFRECGVSRVLNSSCIRPYTPVFRARLPCPHKKCLVVRGALC